MINTNELRRGNWVMMRGKIDTITEIGQADNGYCEKAGYFNADKGYIEPIPVTAEWLEMLDTESAHTIFDKLYHFHNTDIYLRLTDTGVDVALDSIEGIDKHYFRYNLQFVHELQNLYFAIFNEELKLKAVRKLSEIFGSSEK
jgi:hypothetical protein